MPRESSSRCGWVISFSSFGLYLRILFGLQLIDYLIFALLVLVVHAVVNQKQLGYLAALVAYGVILFPSFLGIKHHLLIYGSGPRWSYSVISGFGASLAPWMWFKLYWAGWALLLAVAARLLWARGAERGLWSRLHLARRRFTRPTAAVAAIAVTLILSAGGFIFYNTNVLHAYATAADRLKRRADYEKRYGQNSGIPQPRPEVGVFHDDEPHLQKPFCRFGAAQEKSTSTAPDAPKRPFPASTRKSTRAFAL
ncbi:MAG: hypothetical protein L0Z50_01200 [Verrucomicrobiales bacterium]|nr:hypothetical protein [Verrucomicrobiales bacterium]